MEGFERERRPAPEFEPPVEPGDGTSLRGLAAVAKIFRANELAADAAGIPPLDSDQVLDLQRTAGKALPHENVAQELLEGLFADTGLHDAIAAALDSLEPCLELHVTGPNEPTILDVKGPQGGGAQRITPPATVELSFNALFGPATTIRPDDELIVTVGGETVRLRLPFAEPAAGVRANLR
jgi:hypothetical protein